MDLKVNINIQGQPIINYAFIHKKSDGLVAIAVDMTSKRCEIVATGSNDNVPVVCVEPTEDSLYLGDAEQSITEIEFPEYEGWDIWAADASKYSICLCLVKQP